MNAVIPAAMARRLMASILTKTWRRRFADAHRFIEAGEQIGKIVVTA